MTKLRQLPIKLLLRGCTIHAFGYRESATLDACQKRSPKELTPERLQGFIQFNITLFSADQRFGGQRLHASKSLLCHDQGYGLHVLSTWPVAEFT